MTRNRLSLQAFRLPSNTLPFNAKKAALPVRPFLLPGPGRGARPWGRGAPPPGLRHPRWGGKVRGLGGGEAVQGGYQGIGSGIGAGGQDGFDQGPYHGLLHGRGRGWELAIPAESARPSHCLSSW